MFAEYMMKMISRPALFALVVTPFALPLVPSLAVSPSLGAMENPRNERADTIVTRDGRIRRGTILSETWKNVTYKVTHEMARPVDVVTKDIVRLVYYEMEAKGLYSRAMASRQAGEYDAALRDLLSLSGYRNAEERAADAALLASNPDPEQVNIVDVSSKKEWERFYGTFEVGATYEMMGRYDEAAEAFAYIGDLFPEHRLAASVWYRAGLNAALAGDSTAMATAIGKLEPMGVERGERRDSSMIQAMQVAKEVGVGKVDKAILAARRVRLSPDGDGVWRHWKTYWSGVLLKAGEYSSAVLEIQDMLSKARGLTPAERVDLQLSLAKAQMNVDAEAAALTCAAIDAAPGGGALQRQQAQLLLAQAWWQQIPQLASDSRRSAEEYRAGLIERVRSYSSRLKSSESAAIADAATDLHLAVESEFPPVSEEEASPEGDAEAAGGEEAVEESAG